MWNVDNIIIKFQWAPKRRKVRKESHICNTKLTGDFYFSFTWRYSIDRSIVCPIKKASTEENSQQKSLTKKKNFFFIILIASNCFCFGAVRTITYNHERCVRNVWFIYIEKRRTAMDIFSTTIWYTVIEMKKKKMNEIFLIHLHSTFYTERKRIIKNCNLS